MFQMSFVGWMLLSVLILVSAVLLFFRWYGPRINQLAAEVLFCVTVLHPRATTYNIYTAFLDERPKTRLAEIYELLLALEGRGYISRYYATGSDPEKPDREELHWRLRSRSPQRDAPTKSTGKALAKAA